MAHVVAWGGAVVFIGALTSGVVFYLGPLGDALLWRGAAREAGAAALNVLLFGLFAAHHSLMARAGAKAWLLRIVPRRLERTTYVWIASLLFVLVCLLWQPIGGAVYRLEGAAGAAAAGVQLAGVALVAAAIRRLSWGEITGVLQATGRGGRPPTEGAPVLSTGVYAFVRHPIYLGWILMTFASPQLTGGRLLFAVVSAAYLVIAIRWEERSLAAVHGDAYTRYCAQVRWRIVPGLY